MDSPSRRTLLKAALLGPAAAAVSLEALKAAIPSAHAAFAPAYAAPSRRYLTASEHGFVEAAVARIIPADHLGPGAKEAGVADFIDRQLAGPYGAGDHFFLQRIGGIQRGGDGLSSRDTFIEQLFQGAASVKLLHFRVVPRFASGHCAAGQRNIGNGDIAFHGERQVLRK